jgi:hypothetical protein
MPGGTPMTTPHQVNITSSDKQWERLSCIFFRLSLLNEYDVSRILDQYLDIVTEALYPSERKDLA